MFSGIIHIQPISINIQGHRDDNRDAKLPFATKAPAVSAEWDRMGILPLSFSFSKGRNIEFIKPYPVVNGTKSHPTPSTHRAGFPKLGANCPAELKQRKATPRKRRLRRLQQLTGRGQRRNPRWGWTNGAIKISTIRLLVHTNFNRYGSENTIY